MKFRIALLVLLAAALLCSGAFAESEGGGSGEKDGNPAYLFLFGLWLCIILFLCFMSDSNKKE